ncbi:MAG: sensor histidine kinase [Ktedonobacteraceae bacterium]
MKQHIRRVHPLCWFLLVWLVGSWIAYWILPFRENIGVDLLILYTVFLVIHIGIYWLVFSRQLEISFQYLILLVQAIFVLLLTQISQNEMTAFTLSLVLFVAMIEMLKRVRPILLVISSYLVLFFLYMHTIGSPIQWLYLWRGDNDAPEIAVILVLAGLVLYLQQHRAHERTQAVLNDLNAAHVQLSAYALRVEELTMLTERQRLARELHDTVSQGLVGLVMQLEAASSYSGKGQSAQAQEIVLSAITRARTVLTETRYVLHDLHADRPRSDDLPDMVQEEIDHFISDTGIPCIADLEALTNTPEVHCSHVLRTISEGLANVAQHAQAHNVRVCTAAHEQMLDIEVRDDGIGFDPVTVVTSPGHYGLQGLRERVRLIGGRLDILSSPGKGTIIRIGVPVENDARSCV